MNIREGTARDRDAILALRRAVFPRDDVEKQRPEFWEWQFGRGRTFVAEEGGRVVGHLGFVPCRAAGVAAMLACDAMVEPGGRGAGSVLGAGQDGDGDRAAGCAARCGVADSGSGVAGDAARGVCGGAAGAGRLAANMAEAEARGQEGRGAGRRVDGLAVQSRSGLAVCGVAECARVRRHARRGVERDSHPLPRRLRRGAGRGHSRVDRGCAAARRRVDGGAGQPRASEFRDTVAVLRRRRARGARRLRRRGPSARRGRLRERGAQAPRRLPAAREARGSSPPSRAARRRKHRVRLSALRSRRLLARARREPVTQHRVEEGAKRGKEVLLDE